MQAVYFVAVFFFARGIGSLRCGLFCSRVGVPQGQLYATVFVVLGGLRKCKPFILSRCFFLHAVLDPCGAVCFVVGWVAWFFFKKISRFGLLFIVNFYFQNSISRQQCTDSVQNHKVDTLARYISYSRVK